VGRQTNSLKGQISAMGREKEKEKKRKRKREKEREGVGRQTNSLKGQILAMGREAVPPPPPTYPTSAPPFQYFPQINFLIFS